MNISLPLYLTIEVIGAGSGVDSLVDFLGTGGQAEETTAQDSSKTEKNTDSSAFDIFETITDGKLQKIWVYSLYYCIKW